MGGKHIRENALFNKPIFEDRSNEAQKSHISNICEKIIQTTMGFDNHIANMHTKKSPGWGVIGIQNYRACRPVLGNENAVLNNCDVCGLVYDNVRKLEVHEQSTLELDKVEIMKNDRKLLIRHRNREWGQSTRSSILSKC